MLDSSDLRGTRLLRVYFLLSEQPFSIPTGALVLIYLAVQLIVAVIDSASGLLTGRTYQLWDYLFEVTPCQMPRGSECLRPARSQSLTYLASFFI